MYGIRGQATGKEEFSLERCDHGAFELTDCWSDRHNKDTDSVRVSEWVKQLRFGSMCCWWVLQILGSSSIMKDTCFIHLCLLVV